MASCVALVVAAGRGTRFGASLPKQYCRLGGRPVLRHALDALARHPGLGEIAVVIHPGDRSLYDEAVAGLQLLPPLAGGTTRQHSVRLGLEGLVDRRAERVLIHDGARPFPSESVIAAVLAALDDAPAAIAAVPVRDTVKRVAGDRVQGTLDRTGLVRVQTPQGFRYPEILAAHRAAAGLDLPDDAAVAEHVNLAVAVVPGDEDNLKITTADDLGRAERILATRLPDVRTGQGFDVHPFADDRALWLCGVTLAGERGLAGHSDADVGLHALTDAILGAIGAGDIGQHFPPSDPRWRGAPSHLFLAHAAGLVAAAGGILAHVDVTLICERPKIAPHRAAMVGRIAEILGLAPGRVSVKATTTEKLGFTGRGEGIAAQAVATVRLPG